MIQYVLTRGDSSLYAVDATSGVLYTLKEAHLDTAQQSRETTTQHHLVVMAYNLRTYDVGNIRNDSVSITVTVEVGTI